jgi:hypothetical protein
MGNSKRHQPPEYLSIYQMREAKEYFLLLDLD